MQKFYLKDYNVDESLFSSFNKDGTLYINVFFNPITSCPYCNGALSKNGYSVKKIIHSFSTFQPVVLICHMRRYVCKECGKSFYQENRIALPHQSISKFTIFLTLESLKKATNTFESVAKYLYISRQDVINIFDQFVECSRMKPLPKVLSFDEVYIGSKIINDKYSFVLLDFNNKKLVDMLPSRHKYKLLSYFEKIPKVERNNVEYITMDMWETYRDIAKIRFPRALIAVDSFHIIKLINSKLDKVRTATMRKYDNNSETLEGNSIEYYMLKKYSYYLMRDYDSLIPRFYCKKLKRWVDKDDIMKYILESSSTLKECYELSKKYRDFNQTATYKSCETDLDEIIEDFAKCSSEGFKEIAVTLKNWKEEIKNSFIEIDDGQDTNKVRRLSNGPIEGINSSIKKIFMCGNGYGNFERFRNRCIYSINQDIPIKGTPKKIHKKK